MTAVDLRMTRARSQLIMTAPFFGSLAMRLLLVSSSRHRTLAVDGTHLFYNPTFLDGLSEGETRFGVAHEVMHCAMQHHTRRAGRDPELWNIACDHVINLALRKAGFDVPGWVYADPAYEGLNAEQVYAILVRQQQAQQQQPQQQPQQGQDQADGGDDDASDGDDAGDDAEGDDGDSGDAGDDAGQQPGDEGGKPKDGKGTGSEGQPDNGSDPHSVGEVLDAAEGEAAMAEAQVEWEVAVRQAVNVAKAQEAGNVPGYLTTLVQDLNAPRVDYREVLRRFIDPSAITDYSWTKPSKRYAWSGQVLPSLVTDGVHHIAFIIDTSISMDDEAVKQGLSELQAALDEGAVDKVTAVYCDTRVTHTHVYERGDKIALDAPGRGGTAFSPAFKWVEENAEDVAAAIYYTDLGSSDFGPQPAFPVLWAVYGDPRQAKHLMASVPFGECLDLTAN